MADHAVTSGGPVKRGGSNMQSDCEPQRITGEIGHSSGHNDPMKLVDILRNQSVGVNPHRRSLVPVPMEDVMLGSPVHEDSATAKTEKRASLIPISIEGGPPPAAFLPQLQGLKGERRDSSLTSGRQEVAAENSVSMRVASYVHEKLPNVPSVAFEEQETNQRPAPPLASAYNLQISLRTFFVCGFLLFIVALGCSLIAISYAVAADTNRMQQEQTKNMRVRLFRLVEESNKQLIDAAEDSFWEMMIYSAGDLSRQIEENIRSLAVAAIFSVNEMTRLWKERALDPMDLDVSLNTLWELILQYPDVSMINFADSLDKNFVAIGRLPGGEWELELKNVTAKCDVCQAGALAEHKYYYTVTEPYQETGWKLNLNKVYDPMLRPWYKAALEGDGALNWAPMRIFSSGISVGTMITKLIKADDGTHLSVVGSDIDVAVLTTFLTDKRRELATNFVHLANTHDVSEVEEMIQFLVMDVNGIVLGQTHHGESKFEPWFADNLQDAHYTVLFPRGSMTRFAVELIIEHFNGSLSAVAEANFTVIPQPRDAELLVTSRPFKDEYGLVMIIVTVTEKKVYRAFFQHTIDDTTTLIESELNSTTVDMDMMQQEVWDTQNSNSQYGLMLCGLIISVGAAFMFCFTNHITRSLRDLASKMGRVSELDFTLSHAQRPARVQEITRIGTSFHEMMVNLQSFARYVPDTVTRLLVSQKEVAVLGVAPQEVSIMFSDIAGFTTIAESLEPDLLISLLAEYLEAMSDCIQESNGTVGKYIGDGIFSFWNSPFEVPNHEVVACASALRQQEMIKQLRDKWLAEGLPAVHSRIGLSVGSVLHGNIGSRSHMEWGLIGDEVNLASRLENMCKQYGVEILISDAMYERVREDFVCRHLDKVIAVGKSKPTDIWELVAHRSAATEDQVRFCDAFGEIIQTYRQREFETALEMLNKYREVWDWDKAAVVYQSRCRRMMDSPPDSDWAGTFIHTEK